MSKIKLLSESALRKKYVNSSRADIILPDDKMIFLPSRCLSLNWQLGGGILYGRVVELFGYESTGKSLLASDFGVTTQQLGGVVLWGDAEGTFNPHWAAQNGLDPSKVEVYDSNDIEGFSDWCRDTILMYRSKLIKNEPILLVLDSIAALECLDNLNKDQLDGKAEMGNRAKAIYRFYRYRTNFFKQMGVCVVMINQVRKKLNASMFENAETTPGGDSTKFYASYRIGLNGGKQIKGREISGRFEEKSDGQKVGRIVYIQSVKNKVAPPRNSVKTEVYFLPHKFGYVGFSRYGGLPEILELEGIVKKKKGSGFYYKDKFICKGEDSFVYALHNREKLRKLLIKNSPVNTVSKTRAKLAELDRNLFPVKLKDLKEE
jgi:recombination protein RecA